VTNLSHSLASPGAVPQRQSFPELGGAAGQLPELHACLAELPRMHEQLRTSEPEA